MEVTGIPSDKVEIELFGRGYGFTTDYPASRLLQPELGIFGFLNGQLHPQSQLLKLQGGPQLTKAQIFEAYEQDLKLLQGRVKDFEECVRKAIRCSLVIKASENLEATTSQVWDKLSDQIPSFVKLPLLPLNFVRAAKDAPQLLSELQEEFKRGVDRLVNFFSFYLQSLVDKEFIGIVEWSAPDVCRYHYFKQEFRSDVLKKDDTRTEHSYDESQPLGSRNTSTTVQNKTVRNKRYLERHVHHVANCQLHSVVDYPSPVPPHVKEFLDAVPAWLRPELNIVGGQITLEEVIRRKVADETSVEQEVISVYKASPGVLLGHFNLIGWSASDISLGESVFYKGQAVSVTEKRHWRRALVFIIGTTVILLTGIVLFIAMLISDDHTRSARQYNGYLLSLPRNSFNYQAKVSDVLEGVPGSEKIGLRYTGRASYTSNGWFAVLAYGTGDLASRLSFPLSQGRTPQGDSVLYGDANLLKTPLGILAIIRITEATGTYIKYTVVRI